MAAVDPVMVDVVVVLEVDIDDDVLTNSMRPFSTMMLAGGVRIPALLVAAACRIFSGIPDLSDAGELGAERDPVSGCE